MPSGGGGGAFAACCCGLLRQSSLHTDRTGASVKRPNKTSSCASHTTCVDDQCSSRSGAMLAAHDQLYSRDPPTVRAQSASGKGVLWQGLHIKLSIAQHSTHMHNFARNLLQNVMADSTTFKSHNTNATQYNIHTQLGRHTPLCPCCPPPGAPCCVTPAVSRLHASSSITVPAPLC